MSDFYKVICDDVEFIPQKSYSIKELEKEYEKQSKYILDKMNEKYSGTAISDETKLQRRQEIMYLKRRLLDPISERIAQLAQFEINPAMIRISVSRFTNLRDINL